MYSQPEFTFFVRRTSAGTVILDNTRLVITGHIAIKGKLECSNEGCPQDTKATFFRMQMRQMCTSGHEVCAASVRSCTEVNYVNRNITNDLLFAWSASRGKQESLVLSAMQPTGNRRQFPRRTM